MLVFYLPIQHNNLAHDLWVGIELEVNKVN